MANTHSFINKIKKKVIYTCNKKTKPTRSFFLWQGKYFFLNYYRIRKRKRKSNNLLLKNTEWHLCFSKKIIFTYFIYYSAEVLLTRIYFHIHILGILKTATVCFGL
jgi:hypothetical protein